MWNHERSISIKTSELEGIINMKKIIVIIGFFFISFNFAQGVKLGFRSEIFAPSYEKTGIGKTFLLNPAPLNLYFVCGLNVSQNLQIDIRPGYSIIEDYGGFEFGGYIKYFPTENIYFLAAYNAHFMGGEGHGMQSNNETTFLMPGAGIGFVTGKYSTLEFMVFIPSPKEWKYDYEFNSEGFKKIVSKFDLIFKIGFGFDWSI